MQRVSGLMGLVVQRYLSSQTQVEDLQAALTASQCTAERLREERDALTMYVAPAPRVRPTTGRPERVLILQGAHRAAGVAGT